MYWLAFLVAILIVLIMLCCAKKYRYNVKQKHWRHHHHGSGCGCGCNCASGAAARTSAYGSTLAAVAATAATRSAEPKDEVTPMEMVNVSTDRGVMRYSPQPDSTSCYWNTVSSQEDVDQMNRLNAVDLQTPMVAARSNVLRNCACMCNTGGAADFIGKVDYGL